PLGFWSSGLRGDPLLIALAPDLIELHCRKTVLMRHFSKICEGVSGAVETHCASNRLSRESRDRLHWLMSAILESLRQRESDDPTLVYEPILQIWVRKNGETLDGAAIEVLTREEGFRKPHGKHDLLLTLLRIPRALSEEHAFLQHEYIHLDAKGRPMDD